jgi:DNA polymerase
MTDDESQHLRKLLNSNNLFAKLLESLGVTPPTKISPTTGKQAYAFAKTDEPMQALLDHDDPRVVAAVSARLSVKTSLEETRTQTLIGYAQRGDFPIALRYYGAHTGRWSAESSGKVNMQNLPRASKIKTAIKAPEGYVLCGADLSNIELRLGLWLATQDDRIAQIVSGVDLYKDFSKDIFKVPYAEVSKEQRQVGKVSNLSLIYGTGPAKLREALRIMGGVRMELDEVKPIVKLYRERYHCVVDAWNSGEQALRAMAQHQSLPLFRGTCLVEGTKGIRLPNGLHMQYPGLRRLHNEDTGKPEWVFDSKHGPERVYGAKVFQACTQAIARCIMGEGLLKIQKFAPVRLTIHDSAYWLALEGEAQDSLDRGIACITAPVTYCPGLPLAAEGSFGRTLADC